MVLAHTLQRACATVGADAPSFACPVAICVVQARGPPTLPDQHKMADDASVQALRAALQEFEGQAIEQERLRAERAFMEAEDLRAQMARQAARQAARPTPQRAGDWLADSLELATLDMVQRNIFRWAEADTPNLAEQIQQTAPVLASLRADAWRHASRAAPY